MYLGRGRRFRSSRPLSSGFREGFQWEMSVKLPVLLKQQGEEEEDVFVIQSDRSLSVCKMPWDSVAYKGKEGSYISSG